MTDTRLPEKFLTDRRVQRLSDPAHRLHVNAMIWTVANQTDGQIDRDDFELIPRFNPVALVEIVAAGLWIEIASGWLIVDWADTQTSRDELARLAEIRRKEREKKQRQRLKAGKEAGEVPGDSPGGRPGGTHQEGQEGQEGALTTEPSPEVADLENRKPDSSIYPLAKPTPSRGSDDLDRELRRATG